MPYLSHAQLQEFARRKNIRVPILSHKVVGNRIELHLLGGTRVVSELPGPEPALGDFMIDMPVADLRKIASKLKIRGRSKMNKAQLLDHILSINIEFEEIRAAVVAAGFEHFLKEFNL